MNKQEKFLWIMQTALLVNVNNLGIDRPPGLERSDVSMTGNWGAITDAPRASELIPDDLSAEEAAHEYCTFMFSNQRKAEEDASGKRELCPYWFARH